MSMIIQITKDLYFTIPGRMIYRDTGSSDFDQGLQTPWRHTTKINDFLTFLLQNLGMLIIFASTNLS